MESLVSTARPKHEIQAKRREVMDRLMETSATIKSPHITEISSTDLSLLYDLYDSIFFDQQLKSSGLVVNFSLSRRMTRSAGKTIWQKQTKKEVQTLRVFEIRIGVDLFFHYHLTEGSKRVCGLETQDSLEALVLVFEHELCHVLEHLSYGNTNCSKDRFKSIAGNLFAHTASHHQLPTKGQIVSQELNVRPGDTVSFYFQGKKLDGFIHRINKRATVMVQSKNGPYRDKNGIRYSKYYVPLGRIRS